MIEQPDGLLVLEPSRTAGTATAVVEDPDAGHDILGTHVANRIT